MILGSRRRYCGPRDRVLSDKVVVVIAVHRGGRRLERDEDVGAILPDDIVEVSPLVPFEGGERVSCLAHEVAPSSLG